MRQSFALAALVASGCSSPQEADRGPELAVVEVDSKSASCASGTERVCLRIREAGGQWRSLSGGIEGFNWEPGHRYTLEVRVEKVAGPPARGAVRYVLVKEVDKISVRDPDVQIVEVDDRQVECVGEAERTCLQIRRDGDDWELFYGTIEGFTFEPGHRYKLEVRVEKVADPPADGSSVRYKLVKQLEKKPAQ